MAVLRGLQPLLKKPKGCNRFPVSLLLSIGSESCWQNATAPVSFGFVQEQVEGDLTRGGTVVVEKRACEESPPSSLRRVYKGPSKRFWSCRCDSLVLKGEDVPYLSPNPMIL